MFFILSKILHFLLKPILWLFFGGLFGAWKQGKKRRFWIKYLVFAYLISNQFLVDLVFRAWETQPILAKEVPSSAEGILLLGGYSSYDPTAQRPIFRTAADRYLQTLHLSHFRDIDPIIITGGSGNLYKPEEKEGIFINQFNTEANLSSKQFFYESESRNTAQNAVNTLALIKEKGLPKTGWILVTSAFHMRRAVACFKKVGINPIPYPTDHKAGPPKFQFEYCFLPSVDALSKWELLFHEWVGYLSYYATGKV